MYFLLISLVKSDIYINWDNNSLSNVFLNTSFDSENQRLDLGNDLNIAFRDLKFKSKTSSQTGGSIRVPRSITKYEINNTEFTNSSAQESGGALFFDVLHEVNIDNCTFKDNFSNSTGGSVHIISDLLISMNNSIINNSFANSSGGTAFLNSQNIILK